MRLAAKGLPGVTVRTYGEAADADVRVVSIVPQGLRSEVTVRIDGAELTFGVSVPGRHYALNAVAALTAAVALGIPAAEMAPAIAAYTGVKRRLQLKGEAAGVQVIDSYAHHPSEMTADLEAIRGAVAADARLLVLFQPHLFSRTQELGKEMGQALGLADASVVLEIYPAREDPIPGVTSALIIDAARAMRRRCDRPGRPLRGRFGPRGNGQARRPCSHHGRLRRDGARARHPRPPVEVRK